MARWPPVKAQRAPIIGSDGKTVLTDAFAKIGDFTLANPNLAIVNIPQYYNHLRIVAKLRSLRAGITTTGARLFFNGINPDGYSQVYSNETTYVTTVATTTAYVGQVLAAAAGVGYATCIIDIPFYKTSNFKGFKSDCLMDINAFTEVRAWWTSVNRSQPIRQIHLVDDVSAGWESGSMATLYGIV